MIGNLADSFERPPYNRAWIFSERRTFVTHTHTHIHSKTKKKEKKGSSRRRRGRRRRKVARAGGKRGGQGIKKALVAIELSNFAVPFRRLDPYEEEFVSIVLSLRAIPILIRDVTLPGFDTGAISVVEDRMEEQKRKRNRERENGENVPDPRFPIFGGRRGEIRGALAPVRNLPPNPIELFVRETCRRFSLSLALSACPYIITEFCSVDDSSSRFTII